MTVRAVNARQLEVLRWIVEGCPEGVMAGTTHKTTAVALQGRGLAVVSRKDGVWRAEATDAGRHFVKRGDYPPEHWSTGARGSTPAAATRPNKRKATAERGPRGRGPVDQMIADLVAAGGEMTVAAGDHGYWEGLARSAARFNKVPAGKLLNVRRGETWAERVITLEDAPGWMTARLDPVPVAERLRSPHPVVKALRDDRSRLTMRREVRYRALRILDGIAKAAATRGYHIGTPKPQHGYRVAKGYLLVTIHGHPIVVDIDELTDKVPHEPTKHELRKEQRYPSITGIPTHDRVPSGRLRVRILGGWAVRQDAFADATTITVEQRLPVVLQELELRAAALEDRDQRLERERQERRRQWEEARAAAKAQARDHHRAKILLGQADRWRQAQHLDAYIDAMARRAEASDGDEAVAAGEWLAWARQYRSERLDPLAQPPGLPEDPEFTAETLAPFMRGMSPYGPPAW